MVFGPKINSSKIFNATPTPATIGSQNIGQAIRSPEIEFLYFVAYGWVQPFILLLGIVGNTLNLCVLLNPKRKHVTHILMRGMAFSDSVVVYTLIPIIYYRHLTYLNRFNQSIDIYNVHVSETQYALKSFESLFQDTGSYLPAPPVPHNIKKPKIPNEPPIYNAITSNDPVKNIRVKKYSPFEYLIMNRSVVALQPDPKKAVDNWWDWWLKTNLLYEISNLTSMKIESRRGINILKLIKANNTYYQRSFTIAYPSNYEAKHLLTNKSFLVINHKFLQQKQTKHKLLTIQGSNEKINKAGRFNRKKSNVLLKRTQHQLDTKWWAYYRLFGLYLTVNTFFAASTFVTVSMAIERFVTVYYPFKCSRICSKSRTRLMVLLSFLVAIVISLPLAWDYRIVCRPEMLLTKVYGVFSKVMIESSFKGVHDLVWISPRTFINDYLENKTSDTLTFLNDSATNVSTHRLTLVKNITLHINRQDSSNFSLSLQPQSENVTRFNRIKISIYQYISTKTITNKVNGYYREHNIELDQFLSYRVVYKWVWAVSLRMAPIILLLILNILIIVKLKDAAKRRASLLSNSEASSFSAGKTKNTSNKLNKWDDSRTQGVLLKKYDSDNKTNTKDNNRIYESIDQRPRYAKLVTHKSKTLSNLIYSSQTSLESIHLTVPNVYQKKSLNSNQQLGPGKHMQKPVKSNSIKNGVWFSVPETKGLLVEAIPKFEQSIISRDVDNVKIKESQSYCMKYLYNALLDRLRITSLPKQCARRCSSSSTFSINNSNKNNGSLRRDVQTLKYIKREQNLTKLLIAISCLFTVCVTPQVFVMTQGYEGGRQTSYSYHLFTVTSNLLELMNYCLNFYLYCLCSADFRRHLKHFFYNLNNSRRRFLNRFFKKDL